MRYHSYHRYRYVYRHGVDKACLVSTTPLLESPLCQFFTNDDVMPITFFTDPKTRQDKQGDTLISLQKRLL
ncbi:hypothetical protein [Desulforhopalus vacuolatus]|uniref:hypothetical protein n=1 Tax=Desulforhopalus vacuolatus TaxID=40414 RepID=UPI0019637D7E|nr:hypothetical protein [Desulforhopalus vacuolatus]